MHILHIITGFKFIHYLFVLTEFVNLVFDLFFGGASLGIGEEDFVEGLPVLYLTKKGRCIIKNRQDPHGGCTEPQDAFIHRFVTLKILVLYAEASRDVLDGPHICDIYRQLVTMLFSFLLLPDRLFAKGFIPFSVLLQIPQEDVKAARRLLNLKQKRSPNFIFFYVFEIGATL